jgi:LCP family protein required for cell wall assembly
MQPKKYDSFQPKRVTNIDGFFSQPANDRPRQPIFKAPSADSPAGPAKLQDMPRRSNPQSVSASGAVELRPPNQREQPGAQDRPRQRGTAPETKRSKEKHPKSWKRILKRTGLTIFALVLLGGLVFGLRFYKDIARLTGNNNPLSLLGAFHPAHLKNQNGRVNILVAGNSADDAGHDGGNLTDSIMVLSVNTNNNTALMLSVPRDLWVNIPGIGHSKINAAYPNGGMNKLQQVVQDNLGLTIDYQALVNYSAFRDLVNAVGGISITIKSSDPRGIYDPSLDYTSRNCCALAKYPNGPVNLNGKQALNLARARGDAYRSYGFPQADFDRTTHQRQMLIAIKDKASSSAVISNPFKVTSLIDAVGSNVKTNLQVSEIETLYTYMKKIDDTKIDSYNINTLKGSGTTMLANYTSPDGQSTLIPAAGIDDFTDVQTQITKLFTADPITKESATVVVLNATDTSGLATAQRSVLVQKGMTATTADAPVNQPTNTIVDNSQGVMPNTLAYLKQRYKATIVTNVSLTAGYPAADFILILGQAAVPAPKTTTTGQ